MMFFIDNKLLNVDIRRMIERDVALMQKAEQIAISILVDGKVQAMGANWLAALKIPQHELQVQMKMNENEKKKKD